MTKDTTVAMSDDTYFLGGRESGKMFHNHLFCLMQQGCVTLDFEGVDVVGSGWADEVFGRMLLKVGIICFPEMVKFKNVNLRVRNLIDRAVEQRMKLGDDSIVR